jgi:hypothetical protein
LFLWNCIVAYVLQGEIASADDREPQAWSADIDDQLVECDVAVRIKWAAYKIGYGAGAGDVIGC